MQSVLNNREVVQDVQNRVLSLVKRVGNWQGSMSELASALRGVNRVGAKVVPTSPSVLRKVLNNTVYHLRRSGIKVEFSRETDHFRKRIVSLEVR